MNIFVINALTIHVAVRAGRADHLGEDHNHDVPRVRLIGLHAGEVCKLSRQTVSFHSKVVKNIAYCTEVRVPGSRRTPRLPAPLERRPRVRERAHVEHVHRE